MKTRNLKKSVLALSVVLALAVTMEVQGETSTYVFAPDQSSVVQTGGYAGVHETYTVTGQFQLTVDFDAQTASFDSVDAYLSGGGIYLPAPSLGELFHMTELVGTVVSETLIEFDTENPLLGGIVVHLELVLTDGSVDLTGGFCEPYVDGFCFGLDAAASWRWAEVEVAPPNPTPSDIVTITLSGGWGDSCIPNASAISVVGNDIYFDVILDYPPDIMCAAVITPWERTEPVGPLSAGRYAVYALIVGPGPSWAPQQYTYMTEFTVSDRDVSWIGLGGCPADWSIEPGAPSDSDVIHFSGSTPTFSNTCYAEMEMGTPKLTIDPASKSVELWFLPPPPPGMWYCFALYAPVCGLEGSFGPLETGQWRFFCNHPDATFSIPFEVGRAPVTYYIDGVNGNDDNDGLSLETAFSTIQKGANSALDGDTVLVYPAIYHDPVDFKGKAITVQGVATEAGIAVIEAAVLVGSDWKAEDYGVSFYTSEGRESVLKNFVIRNSVTAIFITDASPRISNVTIVDNEFGIAVYSRSEPDISNCIFWNNTDGDLFGCEARYSCVRSEIEQIEGIIAYWKFDEGSGTTTADSVGSFDGTINGAQWTTGYSGTALSFDGNDGVYLEGSSGTDSPLNIYDTDLTISTWVKIIGTGGTIVARSKPHYITYRLGVTNNKAYINTYKGGPGHWVLRADEILEQEEWYHIVGVFDRTGDRGRVYVNGVEQADGPMTTDPYSNDATTKIGCRNDTSDHAFSGIIDEVTIFNRALSAEEIEQIYFTGAGPLFADAGGGDYHLKSERGRFWPEHNIWVLDSQTSLCVDGGDPHVDPSAKRTPNGGRINIGAYGGTAYASMSEWPIREDNNRDGTVNMIDLAMLANKWLLTLPWADNDPPEVIITNPHSGDLVPYNTIDPIIIEANASDTDGSVVKVEFFANGTKVGEDGNGSNGWAAAWHPESDGSFTLSAKASDNEGATATSPAVEIEVGYVWQ